MTSPQFTPQILTEHNSSTRIFSDLGGGVIQRCQCEPGQARDTGCPPDPHTASTTTGSVAALYVKKNTIYKTLGLDVWDRSRDATRYDGTGPVIAHPPCGHWGVFRWSCKQPGKECGPIAVDQVRRLGGVLEHPRASRLFAFTGCPRTEGQLDFYGGQILHFNQSDYGFPCLKKTTLYVVGLPGRPRLLPTSAPPELKRYNDIGGAAKSRTPLRFALLLLTIVSQIPTPPEGAR